MRGSVLGGAGYLEVVSDSKGCWFWKELGIVVLGRKVSAAGEAPNVSVPSEAIG